MSWAFISIPKTGSNSVHKALNTDKKDNHKAIKLIEADYTFAFIRNPLDRLVSWYHGHKMTSPKLYQYPFSEWVASGCEHHWKQGQLDQFGVENPLNQWEFVEIDSKVEVDFLGKFENLNQDFQTICEVINIRATLPHILKSPHIHYSTYYDKHLKNHTEQMFKKDMDLWETL